MKTLLYLVFLISCGILYHNYQCCQRTEWWRDCINCCYNKYDDYNDKVTCVTNICLTKPVEQKPYNVEKSQACAKHERTDCVLCCLHTNDQNIPKSTNCSLNLCNQE